ncbi:MAG: hypothetical protein QE263_02565 [Vampirovibrionales bacterium]|nr:hypothetical protein [Vampirovibrionales bacterium]
MTADRDRDITPFLEDIRRARTARYEAQFGPLSPLLSPQSVLPVSTTKPRKASHTNEASQRAAAITPHTLALATTLGEQWLTHQHVMARTNDTFDGLLTQLNSTCDDLRTHMAQWFRKSTTRDAFSPYPRAQADIQRQLYARIDADRSVGIVNMLWHTLSFSIRGNNRPLALFSPEHPTQAPVWCGRIVAFLGDFQELTEDNPLQEFNELLPYEVASLYVPASGPLMMRHHHSDDTLELPEAEAVETFLKTVITTVCVGGYFHERDL